MAKQTLIIESAKELSLNEGMTVIAGTVTFCHIINIFTYTLIYAN